MAQKAEVVLIDDLDGSRATETVCWGLDGRHYEIDLSTANAQQLRHELKTYLRHARTTAPPHRRHRPAKPRPSASGPRRTGTRSPPGVASTKTSSRRTTTPHRRSRGAHSLDTKTTDFT